MFTKRNFPEPEEQLASETRKRQCPSILPMGSSSSSLRLRLAQTYLSDDFWYEIFLRLPIDSIFEFRCVSKLWLSILSNPNFINHWYKLNTSLWTLLRVNTTEMNFKVTLSNQESSNTTSFEAGLYILASSNGLVLCTADKYAQTTYYVCNPLTRRWILLPPPPKKGHILITGFTCEETCSSSLIISTTFKVIRAEFIGGISSFKVDIFSSDLGKWNVYDFMCPLGAKRSSGIYENFVTRNSDFYWMRKQHKTIVAFNMTKNSRECRLINLPDRAVGDKYTRLSHCLGESEGLICYVLVKHKERSLSVWVLEEDWCLLHKDTKFYDIFAQMKSSFVGVEAKINWIRELQVIGFNPFDKNVVILGYKKYIWAYNIRSGGYEQISQPCFLGSSLSVPRMGLSPFPLKLRPTTLPPVSW